MRVGVFEVGRRGVGVDNDEMSHHSGVFVGEGVAVEHGGEGCRAEIDEGSQTGSRRLMSGSGPRPSNVSFENGVVPNRQRPNKSRAAAITRIAAISSTGWLRSSTVAARTNVVSPSRTSQEAVMSPGSEPPLKAM